MIKRSKYKEMLQKDLERKKLSVSRLGMEYHLHDLIGAELVERFVCTTPPYPHTFISRLMIISS